MRQVKKIAVVGMSFILSLVMLLSACGNMQPEQPIETQLICVNEEIEENRIEAFKETEYLQAYENEWNIDLNKRDKKNIEEQLATAIATAMLQLYGYILMLTAVLLAIILIILYKKRVYGKQRKFLKYMDSQSNVKYHISVICEILHWSVTIFLFIISLLFIFSGESFAWLV